MKFTNNIRTCSCILFVAICCAFSSCNYLNIVPEEQSKLDDATKDAESTLGFLYSCYAGIFDSASYTASEASADEFALPETWAHNGHTVAYNQAVPTKTLDHRWGSLYRFVGQSHLFLKQLPGARGITEEQRVMYAAEARFIIAYYHFEVLRFYGPCPITDSYVPQDLPGKEYKGRSHYDYVTDWIVKTLDDAIQNGLPDNRPDVSEWGRATTVIAKALKARVLMYAASPLWNGRFPYPTWRNENFETPGYGKELVSKTYNSEKWTRAKAACQEALDAAIAAGHELYRNEEKYVEQKLELPYIPGVNTSTAEGKEFAKKVLLMRYVTRLRPDEGNKEFIWGLNRNTSNYSCSMPHRVLKLSNGSWYSGYSGMAPFLNTIEHFYTKNGKLPANDPEFYDKTDWLKSAGIAGREDITKISLMREPRYYAWMAFSGGDYGVCLAAGKPLKLEMRNGELHGYNPANFNRDNSPTGFLNQKFINPNLNLSPNNSWNWQQKPHPLIRMAELYLNLAECQAALDDPAALDNLNIVRERAGVPELTSADIGGKMTLTEWVRDERFIELWGEGHRYFDIRRWVEGPRYLAGGVREGLNAERIVNPSFEVFNQRIKVNQPYTWSNRMYIAAVYFHEVYKNPQMVQAPGY